jgi:hypothetical protein
MDVLEFETRKSPKELQVEDLVRMGMLILSVASRARVAQVGSPAFEQALDIMKQHYSTELMGLVEALVAGQTAINEICRSVSNRMMDEMDISFAASDSMHSNLQCEYENGRLLKLLLKLGFINERPEYSMAPQWGDTGDRYVLRLFRDYCFHQTFEDGAPALDAGHIISTLNKLDAGDSERIALSSRNSEDVLVVSFEDIRRSLDASFQDLNMQSERAQPSAFADLHGRGSAGRGRGATGRGGYGGRGGGRGGGNGQFVPGPGGSNMTSGYNPTPAQAYGTQVPMQRINSLPTSTYGGQSQGVEAVMSSQQRSMGGASVEGLAPVQFSRAYSEISHQAMNMKQQQHQQQIQRQQAQGDPSSYASYARGQGGVGVPLSDGIVHATDSTVPSAVEFSQPIVASATVASTAASAATETSTATTAAAAGIEGIDLGAAFTIAGTATRTREGSQSSAGAGLSSPGAAFEEAGSPTRPPREDYSGSNSQSLSATAGGSILAAGGNGADGPPSPGYDPSAAMAEFGAPSGSGGRLRGGAGGYNMGITRGGRRGGASVGGGGGVPVGGRGDRGMGMGMPAQQQSGSVQSGQQFY